MKMRKLNLGMVSLVPGRIRGAIPVSSKVRDELEALLDAKFFEGAAFDGIGIIIRVGRKTNLSPEYQPIEQHELPVAIELPMSRLSKAKGDELASIFRWALLEALLAVAEKYKLPTSRLLAKKQKDLGSDKPAGGNLQTADEYLN